MIRNWGIRRRVLLLALVPVVCLGIVLGTYLTRVRVHDLQASEHVLGDTLANQLASASEYGVFTNNVRILKTLAHTVAQEPGVEAITIKNRHNDILAQIIRPVVKNQGVISELARLIGTKTGLESTLTFTRTIYLRSIPSADTFESPNSSASKALSQSGNFQVLGKVTVKLSETHFAERQTQIIVNGGIIILSCLTLSILLALVIGGSVAVPITRVIDMVSRFSSGDHAARVPERSGGEIGQLEKGINLMAANSEHSQQELQEQVKQATAELRETLGEMEVKNVELDLARKRALELGQVKSDFLSNMSHEIRTPMNAIVGFTGLLAKTRMNKDQRYYLDTVQHSAANLLTLIDDVLGLQSLEAGKPVQAMVFNLRELIEQAIKLVAPEAYMKELELVMHLPINVPINYMGDAIKLSRVLINLLSNAVKFTEHGQIMLGVHAVTKSAHRITLQISIQDTGIGIREEHLKDLFKPFTVFNTATNQRYSGTGLGLAISRQLMDALSGSISVSSHIGEGSDFRVELTLDLIDAPMRTLDVATPERILVYESNIDMGSAIQSRLEALGYSVNVCHGVDKLSLQMNAADISRYNLLMLSLSYRELRDIGAVCHLLKDNLRTPIVVLVNSLESDVQNSIAKSTGGLCLPKCVDTVMLEKKIHQLLPQPTSAPATKPDIEKTPSRSLRGHIILVVEDNRINRQLIVLQLRNLGATVMQAEDSATALQCFADKPPDAIIMDMWLREETGLDVASKLSQAMGDHKIPILMLSATREQAAIEESRALGISRWLLKPVDEWVLEDALQDVLSTAAAKTSVKDRTLNDLNNSLAKLRPEIIDMLRQDLPLQQHAVFSAWDNNDIAALQEALHVLHGTTALCRLSDLNSYCSSMETMLEKQAQAADISPYKIKIKTEIEKVIALLEIRSHESSSYT